MMWGAEDLSTDLGGRDVRDGVAGWRDPYRLARSLCLIAAAAAEVPAIDTVYTAIDDKDGLSVEAVEAFRDGFAGKAAIHPAQIEPINAAFTPSPERLAWARGVVAAFAADPDAGVVRLDGEMVDRPHLVAAQRILRQPRP
jgi:citrate lyase subunit beta/citryl-CoA lyase